MQTKQDKIIMFNSDEAAQYRTNLTGWVSGNGRYFGEDERAARYDGCTHTRCEECDKPVDRGRLICPQCYELRQIKRYAAMLKEKWNGKGGLYSDASDKYFWSWDEVDEYCCEEGIEIGTLRLIICEPVYLPLIQDDYGCDELPEDGELPDSIIQAIQAFNKIVKEAGPVAWQPGKKAAKTDRSRNEREQQRGNATGRM